MPSTMIFNNNNGTLYDHNLHFLNNRGTGESTDLLLDETLKRGVVLERQRDFVYSEDSSNEFFSTKSFVNQKSASAKQIFHSVVYQRLNINDLFDKDQASGWAFEIAQEVKQRLTDLGPKQYKYIVNVTIMENKSTGNMVGSSSNQYHQILLRIEMAL
ncbi:15379_t:CDS:2 [Acaulospora morrowiae]|uniref:15379_t:CDS:1 n=1 Tax=Acaulospora morrowiae TaxID=94023 RepID=A0A9N9FTX8_9GLOM|nr:15379_t:CDS:2 [Acaulospora morrowiae]